MQSCLILLIMSSQSKGLLLAKSRPTENDFPAVQMTFSRTRKYLNERFPLE